jgi:hypothetical protein
MNILAFLKKQRPLVGIAAYFTCGFTSRAEHREYIHAAATALRHSIIYPLIFAFMMMFFGQAPGIVLSLFIRYYPSVGMFETVADLHFIVPLVLSWGGYRCLLPDGI